MNDFWQQTIGMIVALGVPLTGWIFARVRKMHAEMTSNLASEALVRLSEIVGTVVLDSTEVFVRDLMEALKDGKLETQEFQDALQESTDFAWSLIRNQDKRVLAGGLDENARKEFEAKLKARIVAGAREALDKPVVR